MTDFDSRFKQARDIEYWRQLNPELHITDEAKPITIPTLSIDPQLIEDAKASVKAEGYFQVENLLDSSMTSKLAVAVERVHKAGWSTPFVIVYDEYWEMFHTLRQLFGAILGDDYKQVPNFWCWFVDTNKESKGWGHHRDRPAVNTILETGLPATLTTWIPLTKATTANGCIYIVPSTRDPNYPPGELDRRDIHELQNIRALPANPGDVLGWTEALLHWGSRSSNKAANPRISISFTFQRADKNPYEVPLFEPSRYHPFDERVGFIATTVCNYEAQGTPSPAVLHVCRRLASLIPAFSIQDGLDRQTFGEEKRLSESILWKFQKQYFDTEGSDATTRDRYRFYSTNRMPFVETFAEMVSAALRDCATMLDYESPQYILEIGGGSGCFASRFLNELADSKEDFEFLKKLNIKYLLTDYSEPIVQQWRENKNLAALVEQGVLDFAVFDPQRDKSITPLLSGQTITTRDIKNPLIVIANHVFDCIEEDAFRSFDGVLQENKVTLFREGKSSSFDKEPNINDIKVAERFFDINGPYYENAVLDSILDSYRNEQQRTFTFPIGAIRCIENLSAFCEEKLILLSADTGYVRLDTKPVTGLNRLDFERHGSCSFALNFDALSKYIEGCGGTSLVEQSDYSGLRVAFTSLIHNRFQGTKHFFRHQLEKKGFLDSQYQIKDLIQNGLKAGDYESSRVSLFLSIVRAYNYDPDIFSTAHKILLDERFKDLESMNNQVRSELQDTLHRTIRHIFIVDEDYKIFDSILRLYIQLDWFEVCLKFCEEIIATYGNVGTAIDHAALSCEALKKHKMAFEYFQTATRIPTSDYKWANAGMARMAKELYNQGDSIVRVTIARAK
jgi:hypothetical protein